MTRRYSNPEPFRGAGRPYSMIVQSGQILFMAGHLGVRFADGQREVVHPGNAPEQLRQILLNMRSVLADVGADLHHICWLQLFVTNIDDRLPMDAVRRDFFTDDAQPAATLVEVSRLALPGAVVEVNAIASLE